MSDYLSILVDRRLRACMLQSVERPLVPLSHAGRHGWLNQDAWQAIPGEHSGPLSRHVFFKGMCTGRLCDVSLIVNSDHLLR